jgi:hypothetical protein
MKKIRKGDVVIIHTAWTPNIGFPLYGCLGEVESFVWNDEWRVRVAQYKKDVCFSGVCHLYGKDLEVIDHIDETPEPRVGDVAVYKYLHQCTELQGALVIVEELGEANGYDKKVPLVRINWGPRSDLLHVNKFNELFEVIDHIGETTEPRVGDVVVITKDPSEFHANIGLVIAPPVPGGDYWDIQMEVLTAIR